MATHDDLDIAEAIFRHQLRTHQGAVVFLASGSSRDDPDADLVARLAAEGFPVKPVSAADTSERTQTASSSTTVSLPTGPWWRQILAILGPGPSPTVTSGQARSSTVTVRRLTDQESGATGTLIRVGEIRHSGPDEAEVKVEVSGEPLPTVETTYRVMREGDGWSVAPDTAIAGA